MNTTVFLFFLLSLLSTMLTTRRVGESSWNDAHFSCELNVVSFGFEEIVVHLNVMATPSGRRLFPDGNISDESIRRNAGRFEFNVIPQNGVDATDVFWISTYNQSEFFLPDDPQFFWSQLPGEKYLRMVQDAEHSMAGHAADLASNIQTFAHAVKTGVKMPEFFWDIDNITGAITVTTYDKPIVARMWHAKNLHKRDFRLIVCGDPSNISCINPMLWDYVQLDPTTVSPDGLYTYVAIREQPPTGWGAHYVEMHYNLFETERDNIKFTTEVSIIPTTLPYPSCGQHC